MQYYRLDGTPCPESEFGEVFNDPARVLAKTEIGRYEVSTVFLVIDHGFGSGPPVLWETIVFGNDESEMSPTRYTSREAALKGHAAFVATIREWQS